MNCTQDSEKRNKISETSERLSVEVERLDRQDYKSDVRWGDESRFIDTHFSDEGYEVQTKNESGINVPTR